MGSGAIAGIVIMVLIAFAGGIAFIVLWKTREQQMRKLLGLNRELSQSPRRGNAAGNSGFENLVYDANNTEGNA
jgi:hypothetical protein